MAESKMTGGIETFEIFLFFRTKIKTNQYERKFETITEILTCKERGQNGKND